MTSNRWILAWLEAGYGLRLMTVLGGGAVLFFLLWLYGLHPVQQQRNQLARQEQQQSRQYQQRLQALRALPALSQLEQQYEQLNKSVITASGIRFSLPALLSASGGTLEHWQPEEEGGELALVLNWQQVMDLLNYLLQLNPTVSIPAWTLQGTSPQLRLLVKLHHEK